MPGTGPERGRRGSNESPAAPAKDGERERYTGERGTTESRGIRTAVTSGRPDTHRYMFPYNHTMRGRPKIPPK